MSFRNDIESKSSPLFDVINAGDLTEVKLLSEGADLSDPNFRSSDGLLPFFAALKAHHFEVAKYLLEMSDITIIEAELQGYHHKIIQYMRLFGFNSDSEGACNGVTQATKLASLTQDEKFISAYFEILVFLNNTSVKDLLQIVENHEKLEKDVQQKIMQEFSLEETKGEPSPEQLAFIRKKVLQKMHEARLHLSPESQEQEKRYQQIYALFNTIQLQQEGRYYVSTLTRSEKLILVEEKEFNERVPTAGEFQVCLNQDGSLRYKILSPTGTYQEAVISLEDLQKILKEIEYLRYTSFAIQLGHTTKEEAYNILQTFLPDLLLIPSFKGHSFAEGPKRKIDNTLHNAAWVTPLVQPKELERRQGEVKLNSFFGAYNSQELTQYFQGLRNSARKIIQENEYKDSNAPIALTISSSGHVISVIYWPRNDQFEFFDINPFSDSPHRQLINGTEIQVLQEKVSNSLKPDEIKPYMAEGDFERANVLFQTIVSTTGEDKQCAKAILDAWMATPKFKSMHAITKENMQRFDVFYRNLLYLAVLDGDSQAIYSMLKCGASANLSDHLSESPLFEDLQQPWEAASIHQDSIKVINELYMSPLLLAFSRKNADIVRILLQHGGDPNAKLLSGYTLLGHAAQDGNLEMVKTLLDHGADPTLESHGMTALYLAVLHGHLPVVQALLLHEKTSIEQGKSLEDGTRFTPLMAAFNKEKVSDINIDIVQALVDAHGRFESSPNIIYLFKQAALSGNVKLVRAMLSGVSNTNELQFEPDKVKAKFEEAVTAGNVDLVNALLLGVKEQHRLIYTSRMPVGGGERRNVSVLDLAVSKGKNLVIKALLQNKVDPNFTSPEGDTPFLNAVKKGKGRCVEAFLEAKELNLHHANAKGETAVRLAIETGNLEILKLLLKKDPSLKNETIAVKKGDLKSNSLQFFPANEATEVVSLTLFQFASHLDKTGIIEYLSSTASEEKSEVVVNAADCATPNPVCDTPVRVIFQESGNPTLFDTPNEVARQEADANKKREMEEEEAKRSRTVKALSPKPVSPDDHTGA